MDIQWKRLSGRYHRQPKANPATYISGIRPDSNRISTSARQRRSNGHQVRTPGNSPSRSDDSQCSLHKEYLFDGLHDGWVLPQHQEIDRQLIQVVQHSDALIHILPTRHTNVVMWRGDTVYIQHRDTVLTHTHTG